MEELTPACLGRMEIVSSWDWNSRTWSDWSPVLPPPQGQPYAVKCSRLSWLLLCYISMIMSCGLTQPVWFNCHNVNALQCNGVGVDRLLCCGWQCSVQSSRDDIIRPTTNTRLDSSHTLRQTSDYLLTNDWNNSATEKLVINSSSSPPSHHKHHPPTLSLLLCNSKSKWCLFTVDIQFHESKSEVWLSIPCRVGMANTTDYSRTSHISSQVAWREMPGWE